MKIKILFIILFMYTIPTQGAAALTFGTIAAYAYLRDLWDERIHSFNPPETASFNERERYHRLYILKIINSLAPELYNEIIKVDQNGEDHIIYNDKSYYGATIKAANDGLPLLKVGERFPKRGYLSNRCTIAHELGHYVLLGHTEDKLAAIKHSSLATINSYPSCPGIRLDFKCAFLYSQLRIQEYEADRFAVLNMGMLINDMIKTFNTRDANHGNKTFNATHPRLEQRLEHIKNLKREVELQKAHGGKLPQINWNSLIEEHRKLEAQKTPVSEQKIIYELAP